MSDRDIDDVVGDAQFKYILANLLTNLAFYAAALAPAVALSKSLKDRCVGEGVFIIKATSRFGWMLVLGSALVISFFELVMSFLLGRYGEIPAGGHSKYKWMVLFAPVLLIGILDFKKRSDVDAELAAKAASDRAYLAKLELAGPPEPEPSEPRGFWVRVFWWCFFVIGSFAAMFLLLLLIGSLAGDFG
jgi:hypothetical protein